MSKRKYFGLFGLVLLIVAAVLVLWYMQAILGWFPTERYRASAPPTLTANGNAEEAADAQGEISILNIGITVILFILIAFSVLNVYSFFNAQIDTEKAQLRASTTSIERKLKQVTTDLKALEDRESRDYLYGWSFQRLLSDACPVYLRVAAAGYFVENQPTDTDLAVLRQLSEQLREADKRYGALVKQLEDVIREWDSESR